MSSNPGKSRVHRGLPCLKYQQCRGKGLELAVLGGTAGVGAGCATTVSASNKMQVAVWLGVIAAGFAYEGVLVYDLAYACVFKGEARSCWVVILQDGVALTGGNDHLTIREAATSVATSKQRGIQGILIF